MHFSWTCLKFTNQSLQPWVYLKHLNSSPEILAVTLAILLLQKCHPRHQSKTRPRLTHEKSTTFISFPHSNPPTTTHKLPAQQFSTRLLSVSSPNPTQDMSATCTSGHKVSPPVPNPARITSYLAHGEEKSGINPVNATGRRPTNTQAFRQFVCSRLRFVIPDRHLTTSRSRGASPPQDLHVLLRLHLHVLLRLRRRILAITN